MAMQTAYAEPPEEADMTSQTIRDFADKRETSIEVAQAIFDIAAAGDEHRMWESPTQAEIAAVEARAWELAADDEDALVWGVETIRRKVA